MQIFTFLFWPNPGLSSYSNPKIMLLALFCAGLVAASFVLRRWRDKKATPVMKKLAKGWPGAAMTFGLFGLLFIIARVEGIQYISMRVWWLVWGLCGAFYVYLQLKKFRARYYEVLPATSVHDPRSKYLPKKKR